MQKCVYSMYILGRLESRYNVKRECRGVIMHTNRKAVVLYYPSVESSMNVRRLCHAVASRVHDQCQSLSEGRWTGCRRWKEVVNQPAVSRNAPEHWRSKNIDRLVLVSMLVTGHNILRQRPLARASRLDVILGAKRRRTVQLIFHDLT